MFLAHDHSPSKKTFHKPNILRRKTKITSISTLPSTATPVLPQVVDEKLSETCTDETAEVSDESEQRVQLDVCVARDEAPPNYGSQEVCTAGVIEEGASTDAVDCGMEGGAVDVEAFLNGGQAMQYKAEYESDIKSKNHSLQEWQINFGNAAENIIIEPYEESQVSAEDGGRAAAHLPARPAKFKCDEPDCNKQFLTEQKLRRHRSVHNKQARAPRAAAVECPVRLERPCGLVFPARALLARHLREDHAPDDAPHRCGECGRRFFWAVGLRAHVRAHSARAPLACLWPGCGRAFRQPCRLREHARAHTGDRPYPCRHPGCGWAFRTASKLLRHARRHTGERRHACACGRAFHRREHLRDHQARHRRPARAVDVAGRAQSRGSVAGRAQSPGSVAGRAQSPSSPCAPQPLRGPANAAHEQPAPAPPDPDTDNLFMVQLMAEGEGGEGSEGGEGGDVGEGGEGVGAARCARTHLTWPLAPPADCAPEERARRAVRSDLFLPAGAALADDSQQMASPGVESGPGSPAAASPPHAGLGLLDLMREELMYTDAVDESTFQVLMLSEDLG